MAEDPEVPLCLTKSATFQGHLLRVSGSLMGGRVSALPVSWGRWRRWPPFPLFTPPWKAREGAGSGKASLG